MTNARLASIVLLSFPAILSATESHAFRCGASGTPWFTYTTKIEISPPLENETIVFKKDDRRSGERSNLELSNTSPILVFAKADDILGESKWRKLIEEKAHNPGPALPENVWNDLIIGKPVAVKELSRLLGSKPTLLLKDKSNFGKKLIREGTVLKVQLTENYGTMANWDPGMYSPHSNTYSDNRPKNPKVPAEQKGPTFLLIQSNKARILTMSMQYQLNKNYSKSSYAEAEKKCEEGLKEWERLQEESVNRRRH